jgi:hypothetical protein
MKTNPGPYCSQTQDGVRSSSMVWIAGTAADEILYGLIDTRKITGILVN